MLVGCDVLFLYSLPCVAETNIHVKQFVSLFGITSQCKSMTDCIEFEKQTVKSTFRVFSDQSEANVIKHIIRVV